MLFDDVPELHHAQGHHDVGVERADGHHVDELLQVEEHGHGPGQRPGQQRGAQRGARRRAHRAQGPEQHAVGRHGEHDARQREHGPHHAARSARPRQPEGSTKHGQRLKRNTLWPRRRPRAPLPRAHGEHPPDGHDPANARETHFFKR